MGALQGKPLRRREDSRLLTGQGNYAADAKHPGMLVAVLVRSPHAHADVTRIDAVTARAVPGVLGVFTEADLTDI
jgi:carbon-monoxide dehydrogenase large subunit